MHGSVRPGRESEQTTTKPANWLVCSTTNRKGLISFIDFGFLIVDFGLDIRKPNRFSLFNPKSNMTTTSTSLLRDLVRLPSVNPMGRMWPSDTILYEHRGTAYLEAFFREP